MTYRKRLYGSFIYLCLILAMAAVSLPLPARNSDVDSLLQTLDSVVSHPEKWEGLKRHRLAELHRKEAQARTSEERYWVNKNLYEEYSVFNADSAMRYADRNYEIAVQLNDSSKMMEWEIYRSFIYSVTGLLTEAQDAIERINPDKIPEELRSAYYNQLAYLYSHFGQYLGGQTTSPTDYYVMSAMYQDSTYLYASEHDPLYLWYKGWSVLDKRPEEYIPLINELKADVDSSGMDTRNDAMKAYLLARLYSAANDPENVKKYLAISAICDVKTANKDIASLEELGKMMLSDDDIDRAYAYINYCQQQAQSYNNRVRAISLANTENMIREKYGQRDSYQRRLMRIYLVVLSAVTLILILTILMVFRKNKRLKESQQRLSRLNSELKAHVEELSALRESQEATNTRLKEMNAELSDVNNQLKESNIIKEEYVGHMFTMCSNYINKMDDFRKLVLRKLKAKQFEDLYAIVDSPAMAQNELKEFYQNFDSIFLTIYPDFVKDFNELLRPEERVQVKDGLSLTTELRIYALVRLGITDSVKIAALLHYSPQTVYNNRLRTRNKAIIPKEKFAETVRSLGRYHV